ncbi:MAG: CDP-diacylglycerol--serine O-phosphatidyltransferase [Marinoscillum sp.]
MIRHLPNALTCLNLVTGAAGCISILKGDTEHAIYFVLVAGLFDFFDGFAARLLRVQSAIGKELDSLADMISFGLLPSLYLFVQLEQVTSRPYLPYIALTVAAFSALRLAKFNIDESQSDRFVGVPTPANAILITSITFLPTSVEAGPVLFTVIALATSYLLVSNLPMIALKFKGLAWQPNKWKYLLILSIIVLLSLFQVSSLPFLIPAYLVISILGNFIDSKNV